MAFIVTLEKSPRLSPAQEPLIYVTRDVEGEWRLFLPWFTVTIHRGDWHVIPAPIRKVDVEMKALIDAASKPF